MSGNLELNEYLFVKEGMTRIVSENGEMLPVTVLRFCKSFIFKNSDPVAGSANVVQVYADSGRTGKDLKSFIGVREKFGIPLSCTTEYSTIASPVEFTDGKAQEVFLPEYLLNKNVKVTGTSKGKGFQGVIKRHGFAGGPAAHGSQFHRRPGSIGNRATPARVFAGKKMPGHMGDRTTTVAGLKVVACMTDKLIVLVAGSVPGAQGSEVKLRLQK